MRTRLVGMRSDFVSQLLEGDTIVVSGLDTARRDPGASCDLDSTAAQQPLGSNTTSTRYLPPMKFWQARKGSWTLLV